MRGGTAALAAAQGHAPAQFALGRCLEEGRAGHADPLRALEWYARAASQGHAKAKAAKVKTELMLRIKGVIAVVSVDNMRNASDRYAAKW